MTEGKMRCNVCGHPIEDRGYKHTQCRWCGQVSNLCCDPETPCLMEPPAEVATAIAPASLRNIA